MRRYLVKISGVYYFKRNIPIDLRPLFNGKSILKKSLKTSSLKEANVHLSEYTSKSDHLFSLLSSGYISLSDSQKLISGFYNDCGLSKSSESANSPSYSQLVQIIKDILTNTSSSDSHFDSLPLSTPKTIPYSTCNNLPKVITLDEILNLYIREKKDKVKPKTLKEYEGTFNTIFRILGSDTDITTIDRAKMIYVRETLSKLPSNVNLSKELRNTPIDQIIKNKTYKPMSVVTADKIISRVSGLFDWCLKNGYTTFNPAQGLNIRDKRKDSEHRNPFTMEDLEIFFTSEIYTDNKYLDTPHSLCLDSFHSPVHRYEDE